MQARYSLFALGAALAVTASPLLAQDAKPASEPESTSAAPTTDSTEAARKASLLVQPIVIQNLRPNDARGINMFEPPKADPIPFTGFKLGWGASFTQQFQSIEHENAAAPRMVPVNGTDVDRNRLIEIGSGFNNATANLYLNAQLARGVRVQMTTYLSSRHHPEPYVKDGYLLIDASPIDLAPLNRVMEYVTVKAGHFEINYGDAHFRRTDNGNAMYNPFVGNLMLDAFTTQIGGEVYFRANDLMAMGAITGGEIKGAVDKPTSRSPGFYGKVGFDKQLTQDLRVRLTGSAYGQAKAASQTLYSGDRAGSRYYSVVDSVGSTTSAQFTSGAFNPGFNKVQSFMVNPFVKFQGLELFGLVEQTKGRMPTETAERTWKQYAADVVYRFGSREQLYVGGRYNMVEGRFRGWANDISSDRVQASAGWFITPAILLKGEYVTQKYNDFPTTDYRHGAKFNGFVVEGVVSF